MQDVTSQSLLGCVCGRGVCMFVALDFVQVCHWKRENLFKSTLTFKPSSGWAFNTHTEKSKISFKCSWPERNNNKRKHQLAMSHWIPRAVTKAKLNQPLEHLTAEQEVTRLTPRAGPIFRVFKSLGNEGIAFALQTARPSRGSYDDVKWRSRLQ